VSEYTVKCRVSSDSPRCGSAVGTTKASKSLSSSACTNFARADSVAVSDPVTGPVAAAAAVAVVKPRSLSRRPHV
jgi:hypothetical protein